MRKVLVVDDNELVGKMVAYHLGKVDCDVVFCHNGFGVLHMMRMFKPDVLLLDMKMPGLSGRGVASLLRKESHELKCKIIIFSSEDEHLQKQMVDEGLADGYCVKSHSFEGLKEMVCGVTD